MERFIAAHGITRFKMNPHFPVNTLLLMRGAVAAEQDGALIPYVETGLTAMWEEGLNMSEDAVIQGVLEAADLDAAALLAAAQDADVKARLLENTQRSYDRGAFGSPSFYVGDELFFGKDRLRDAEDEIGRQLQLQNAP